MSSIDSLSPRCFNPGCDKQFESVNDMVAVPGRGGRSPRHFCEGCAERVRRGPPLTDGGTDRYAVAELGAVKLAVKIDGKWCQEQRWYTADLPVFYGPDGSEVDIRDDGSILYESPDGAVEELEPVEENDGQEIYEPMSVYPADRIEVRHINRRPIRTEKADFGGGSSTGVQDL